MCDVWSGLGKGAAEEPWKKVLPPGVPVSVGRQVDGLRKWMNVAAKFLRSGKKRLTEKVAVVSDGGGLPEWGL